MCMMCHGILSYMWYLSRYLSIRDTSSDHATPTLCSVSWSLRDSRCVPFSNLMVFFVFVYIFFYVFFFFFFQAEDGIRDVAVTGVQTCALPISLEVAPGFHTQSSPVLRASPNRLRRSRNKRPAASRTLPPAGTPKQDPLRHSPQEQPPGRQFFPA